MKTPGVEAGRTNRMESLRDSSLFNAVLQTMRAAESPLPTGDANVTAGTESQEAHDQQRELNGSQVPLSGLVRLEYYPRAGESEGEAFPSRAAA